MPKPDTKKRVKFKRQSRNKVIKVNPALDIKIGTVVAKLIKDLPMSVHHRVEAVIGMMIGTSVSGLPSSDEDYLYTTLEEFFDVEMNEDDEITIVNLLTIFSLFRGKVREHELSNKKK